MEGVVQWFDPKGARGIIQVVEGGVVQRYYLLLSKVSRSPIEIKAGQIATFERWFPAKRPGFLPVAIGVEITEPEPKPITQGLGALVTLAGVA